MKQSDCFELILTGKKLALSEIWGEKYAAVFAGVDPHRPNQYLRRQVRRHQDSPQTARQIESRSQPQSECHGQYVAERLREEQAGAEIPGAFGRAGRGIRQRDQYPVQLLRGGREKG